MKEKYRFANYVSFQLCGCDIAHKLVMQVTFHSLKPSGVFSFRYMPRLCAAVGKAMFHLQLAPTHQKKLEPLMTIKSWI